MLKAMPEAVKSKKKTPGPNDKPEEGSGEIKIVCTAERFIELKDMLPRDDNPRVISKDGYRKLRNSMITVGIFKPFIMWRKDGAILGGNQKYWILKDLKKEGWTIPPLPASFVNVNRDVARAIIIRDNVQDGDWEQDGFSRYIAELSQVYGGDTANVLGLKQAQVNDLLLHYTRISKEAEEQGEEIQRSAEERMEMLTQHFMGLGMPEAEARRRAEIYQYSGSVASLKGEAARLPRGHNLGRRIEVTFWFDTVEEVETVTRAFAQTKTVDLDSLKLFRIARRILSEEKEAGEGSEEDTTEEEGEEVLPRKKLRKVVK